MQVKRTCYKCKRERYVKHLRNAQDVWYELECTAAASCRTYRREHGIVVAVVN